ncbi:MAG: gliding motility-associated C-terminal domain-containing protein [Bacteroidota bacterium]
MTKLFLLNLILFLPCVLFNDIHSENLDEIHAKNNFYSKGLKDDLIFASFFSPNGDGHNDTFFIENLKEYPINKLFVFNRWGEVIYQAEPYKNDWDGTMNTPGQLFGNKVPEGMYFYRFEFIIGDFLTQNSGKIILKR